MSTRTLLLTLMLALGFGTAFVAQGQVPENIRVAQGAPGGPVRGAVPGAARYDSGDQKD